MSLHCVSLFNTPFLLVFMASLMSLERRDTLILYLLSYFVGSPSFEDLQLSSLFPGTGTAENHKQIKRVFDSFEDLILSPVFVMK